MVYRIKFICSILTILLGTINGPAQVHELTVQTGHSLAITDLAFSPDGRYIASSGDDNHVIIWDIVAGKQVRMLEGHSGPVNQIAIHPSKDLLASVSDDMTVCIWNYKSGELIRRIPFETDYLKALGFTQEGDKIVVAGNGAFVFDLEDYLPSALQGIAEGGLFDCLSASMNKLAFGGRNGKVYVYNLEKHQIERSYHLICSKLSLSRDMRYLVGAGLSGKLRRWDLDSDLSRVLKLSIPSDKWIDSYHAVAISNDNRYFAGGNRNQKIYVYDIQNAKTHLVISGHDDKVTALAFSPDNRYLASAGKDRIIRIWNTENGHWVKTLKGFVGAITTISANESKGVLALGDNTGYCGIVELWPDGKVYSTRLNPGRIQGLLDWRYRIEDVKFNFDSQKMLIEASLIKETRRKNIYDLKSKPAFFVWDPFSGELNRVENDRPGQLHGDLGFLFFDLDKSEVEQLLISGKRKSDIITMDIPGKKQAKADLYYGLVDDLLKYGIFAYQSKEKEYWQLCDLQDGEVEMEGELSGMLKDAAISGNYIVLRTLDDTIRVFSVSDNKQLYTLHGDGPLNASENILFIASGKNFQIVDLEEGTINSTVHTSHSNAITSFSRVSGRDALVTGSADGSLRFYDIKDNSEAFRMVAVPPQDKILISPDNYYMATKGALKGVGFTVGPQVYSFEQFDLIYNRPDKVLVNTGLADSTLITNYRRAYDKRLKKLGRTEESLKFQSSIPELVLDYEQDILSTKTGRIDFRITAKAAGSRLDRLYILVNGVPESGKLGMSIEGSSGDLLEQDINLDLNPGMNEIQVYVTDEAGVASMRQNFQVNFTTKGDKPDLYLIAIGTSRFEQSVYNLTYAAKDASDVTETLGYSKAFNKIHSYQVLDEEVTLESLAQLEDFIKDAGVNDVVIIFVAGHGVLNNKLDYYLSTFDIDFLQPETKGIPYEDLEDLLGRTRSRKKVLFLDACHSGELDKDEMELSYQAETDAGDIVFRNVGRSVTHKAGIALQSSFELSRILFADMRNSNGATVISSAGGAEYALEGKQWNNGVFTYCLLYGITEEQADLNGDGVIMLSELQSYINREVPRLTDGRQRPTSRVENLSNDFRIW